MVIVSFIDIILTIFIAGMFLWFCSFDIIMKQMTSKNKTNEKTELNGDFFVKYLGANLYANSNNGQQWNLSQQLNSIAARLPIKQWNLIEKDIRTKSLEFYERRKLYTKLESYMTDDQKTEGLIALKKGRLNLAKEIVELANLHSNVTEAEMKFIVGNNTDYQWFDPQIKAEFEAITGVKHNSLTKPDSWYRRGEFEKYT